jgi:uncharacterized membrane protein
MRSLIALLSSGAAGVLLVSYHWQRLPEKVASHFNGSGAVDGWMSRDSNFLLSAGLVVGITATFYLLGVMMRRLQPRWINLPNKDYWFAADREEETRLHLATWAWIFGALLNLFLLFIFHQVFLANMSEPVAMDNTVMFAGLVVYLVVSLGSVVVLVVRFGTSR